MEVQGKITEFLEVQKGTSKAGKEWQKQCFIVETNEEWNNVFCFEMFGSGEHLNKIENLTKFNKVGDVVKVEFNVSTNKWKDKYFTSLQAWRIDKVVEGEGEKGAKDGDDLPW